MGSLHNIAAHAIRFTDVGMMQVRVCKLHDHCEGQVCPLSWQCAQVQPASDPHEQVATTLRLGTNCSQVSRWQTGEINVSGVWHESNKEVPAESGRCLGPLRKQQSGTSTSSVSWNVVYQNSIRLCIDSSSE